MKKKIKIQILSDTHNFNFSINEEADVVIHAGDFSNGLSGVYHFIKKCQDNNKDFIFCLGNHDYYQQKYTEVIDSFLKEYPENFLCENNSITKLGKTFVGGTLFTNFRENKDKSSTVKFSRKIAKESINDFRLILYKQRLISPRNYRDLFNKTYQNILKYKDKEDVVVVTHFPPHISCLDPFWGNHPQTKVLNPYFINDVDISGFKYWIAGHTHTAVDTVVDDCRIIINPFGYPNEQLKGNGFRSNLIIEI